LLSQKDNKLQLICARISLPSLNHARLGVNQDLNKNVKTQKDM